MSATSASKNKGNVSFDAHALRKDFPILQTRVHGKPLVYLDNAATTQKPKAVLDVMQNFYVQEYANVHRGLHWLSQKASASFEAVREKVKEFINASEDREIIYVGGATEGINLVAHSFGQKFVNAGDEILISAMEHHSNIVPWQMLCESKDAKLKIIPMNLKGELLMDEYKKLLTDKTKIVSVVHVSNALGTINPIKEIVRLAHEKGIPVLVDGAQGVAHMPIDVQDLGCDFYTFSGHKMYGPTGIGILYGRAEWLEKMPPYQGGGDMIRSVTFEKTIYNTIPFKFEAGTPNITGVIGLGAALDYIRSIDWTAALAHEEELGRYAIDRLSAIPEIILIGTAKHKTSVVSFELKGIHPHDIGTILDKEGIAIRAGHHCAQPVMDFFGVPATARASMAIYNTREEVDVLIEGIGKVLKIFA